jgi:hypothetical protein
MDQSKGAGVAFKGEPFTVGVPDAPVEFCRFVRHDSFVEADFLPDSEIRARYSTEDHCTYRGFSAWTDEQAARDFVRDILNPLLVEQAKPPFTHIARFATWPKGRHAVAWLGPQEEHWGLWAEAADFLVGSRQIEVFSIHDRRGYDD